MREPGERLVAVALLGAALAVIAAGGPRAARALDPADPDHAGAAPPADLSQELRLVASPRVAPRRSAAMAAMATGGVLLASGLALAVVTRPSTVDASARIARAGTASGAVWQAEDRRFTLRFDPAASSLCIAGGLAASLGAWLFLTTPERLSTDFAPIRNGFLVHYRGSF